MSLTSHEHYPPTSVTNTSLTETLSVETHWWTCSNIRHVARQCIWILKEALILLWNMGWRIKWMIMTIRVILFGMALANAYVHVMWWYITSPQILRHVYYREGPVEDNSNNRAYLDLHYPVPIQQMVYPGSRHPAGNKKFPVVILVIGGAWIIGSHFWGMLLGRIFTSAGFIVVSPDYRNFPQATVSEMVLDVTDAIQWTIKNIEFFGGDASEITILGQSAGAHLIFCAVADQIRQQHFGAPTKFVPSSLKVVAGLSGIYNLPAMEEHLHRRGLYRGVLHGIVGGADKMRMMSPIWRFDELAQLGVQPTLYPRHFMFLHGTNDESSPCSESEAMSSAVAKAASDSNVEVHILEGATHTDPIVEDTLRGWSTVVEVLAAPRAQVPFKPMAHQWQFRLARAVCPF